MIKLKDLLKEAESFTAINKSTGKVSVFKTKDSKDAAVKSGTHDDDAGAEKGGDSAGEKEKPNMFSKDTGYDAPDTKDEPKEEPTKDSTGDRAGNLEVNKKVRAKAKEMGITPAKLGKDEYKKKMAQAAVAALTDANFHSEARQLVADLEGKPEMAEKPEYPSMNDPKYAEKMKVIRDKYDSVYSEPDSDAEDLGISAANDASWDGRDALDSIAFDLKMNGFKNLASKLQSVIKEGRVRVSEAKATPHLSDNEQKKIAKAIEKVTGVSTDYEITDTRYHTGASDFGLAGGQDAMLFVGKYEDGYAISVESNGTQYGFEEAKDFNGAMKSAMKLAKKFKKQLTTESNEGTIKLMNLLRK